MAMGVPTYDEIKEIFESIDKDGDGLITLPELKNTKLGSHLSERELQRIMDGSMDENKPLATQTSSKAIKGAGAGAGGRRASLSQVSHPQSPRRVPPFLLTPPRRWSAGLPQAP